MTSNYMRLPLTLLAAAAMLTIHAPGQNLRERALAATQLSKPEATVAVQELGLTTIPADELAAILADGSPLLQGLPWHRIATQVHVRRYDLMKLWHKDATVRAENTQLFAKLPIDWVRQHAVVGAKKRRCIEAIAAHLPYDSKRVEQMRSEHEKTAASAETLHRIAAKAAFQRATVRIKAAEQKKSDAMIAITDPGDAFSTAAHLASTNPLARSEAAAHLRHLLKLPIPQSVGTELSMHPNLLVRAHWRDLKPSEKQLERYLQCMARGQMTPLMQLADLSDLSKVARRAAARKLITIGLALPTQRNPVTGFLPLSANHVFVDALRLDPNARPTLVGLVVQSKDAAVQTLAITALLAPAATILPSGQVAPIDTALLLSLLQLLDGADLALNHRIARLIDHHLHADVGVKVRDSYARQAKKIVSADATKLKIRVPRHDGFPVWFCGTPPGVETVFGPVDAQTQIVLSAARLGITELIDPLTDLLAQAKQGTDATHLRFLWQALTLLAPHTNAQQATRLFKLAALQKGSNPAAENLRIAWRERVLTNLYGSVPESLLDRLDKQPRSARHLQSTFPGSDAASIATKAMPVARLRRLLLRQGPRATRRSDLYLRCPDLLATAWHSGSNDERAAAVGHAHTLWTNHQKETLQLLLTWPPQFVLHVCARIHTPPSYRQEKVPAVPFQVVQCIQDAPMEERMLAELLLSCSMSESDIDAAVLLAKKLTTDQALGFTRRLCELGEKGRDAARDLIDAQLQHDNLAIARNALGMAVHLRLRNCNWQAAASRVKRLHAILADAAHVQLGDRNVVDCTADFLGVLAVTKCEVDAAVLVQRKVYLPALILRHNQLAAATTAAALSLLAEQEDWSQVASDAVVQTTLSEHPSVRRAAYAALSTRDRYVWPTAWLAYEAALDGDASVRAVAPDAALVKEPK